MDDYKNYLADQVLSEDKIITYRALSRALKVNVNVAKQMLYDFHASQNEKRSGTVHATYMIYGTKKIAETNGQSQKDGDVDMTSSPPGVESALDEIPVIDLSLVAEGCLKEVLSHYETVTSIHVYSLGPHPVKDLQLLADVSKPILDMPAEDDSVHPPKPLGSIRNPYMRRRERRGTAPKPVAPASRPSNAKPPTSKNVPTTDSEPAANVKKEARAEQKPTSKESTPVPSGAKKPAPAPKRGASGGILQSFAKAASMPKKEKTVQPTAPNSVEDSSMQVLSDDGEDDTEAVPEPKKEDETARKSRKDRQEELRRMMEEDSEDEEPEKEDTPMEEPEEEVAAPEPEEKEEPEPAEVISGTDNGRRRGKRRVMKKKTVMDDQGYLVTVQEQGWESFSEDEPAPPPKKTQLPIQSAKPKKAAPKGQGNIMSFFSKK